jgi:RNA-directed DNA polymerase
VQDLNRYLRGWAGYFRYGNSARHFNLIENHAHNRLALFVAKRHQRTRAYGWRVLMYGSPNRLGLVSLSGTVVAPRPHRAWRGSPNAGGEEHRRAVCGRTACTVCARHDQQLGGASPLWRLMAPTTSRWQPLSREAGWGGSRSAKS